MELLDSFEALPPGEDKDLVIYRAFGLDENFTNMIKQAATSST